MTYLSLLSNFVIALVGGITAVVAREILKWWRRPRLSINFLEIEDEKPYIHKRLVGKRPVYDLYLRIKNKGKTPARNCRAKLKVIKKGEELPNVSRLGWRDRFNQ